MTNEINEDPTPDTPVRKKTTKKAEPKTSNKTDVKPAKAIKKSILDSSFNLLDDDADYMEQMKEVLASKSKTTTGFKSANDIKHEIIPWPHPALQYLTRNRGLICGSVNEIIGPDKVGKTALLFTLMGFNVLNNIPCCFINTEMKYPHNKWLARLVSRNPDTSKKILERGIGVYDGVCDLDQMDRCVREFAYYARTKLLIPVSIPILVCVDCISKLESPEEAAAFGMGGKAAEDESSKKGKKPKDKKDASEWDDANKQKSAGMKDAVSLRSFTISDGAKKRGQHATWMAKWMRVLGKWVRDYNITLLIISAQNSDMDAGAASSFIPQSWKNLRNRTKIGGNAVNQSAACQLIAAPHGLTGLFKDPVTKQTAGIDVTLRCEKNSYGDNDREITYQIRTKDFVQDTENYLQPPIEMDDAFCKVMVAHKLMGLRLDGGKYNWEDYGLVDASATDVMRVIESDETLKADICTRLGIDGYEKRV